MVIMIGACKEKQSIVGKWPSAGKEEIFIGYFSKFELFGETVVAVVYLRYATGGHCDIEFVVQLTGEVEGFEMGCQSRAYDFSSRRTSPR